MFSLSFQNHTRKSWSPNCRWEGKKVHKDFAIWANSHLDEKQTYVGLVQEPEGTNYSGM